MKKANKQLIISFYFFIFYLTILIFFLSIIPKREFFSFHGTEFEVRVINGFSDNSSLPLVIWCSSEDSDLGGHALQERDDFSWRLRTNFWNNQRFICTMKWDQRKKRFEVFKMPRDVRHCSLLRKCSWLVTENGFYFSSDEVNCKKDFSWS
ncbi:hypothetical protein UlMin_010218 [Ulmus minor]